MCGITGILETTGSRGVDSELLVRMRDAMVHRGPDGEGIWASPDGRIGLAHRRLAIVDLSDRAAQPMSDGEGRVWITFNGEIYNHLALRRELERRAGDSGRIIPIPRFWFTVFWNGALMACSNA